MYSVVLAQKIFVYLLFEFIHVKFFRVDVEHVFEMLCGPKIIVQTRYFINVKN